MGRIEGKVALVTGAGRRENIGLAVCDAFLREGAKGVVATDMRIEDAPAIHTQIEAAHGHGRFLMLQHDVTDEGAWCAVIAETLRAFGGLDILVNNAGISIHGGIESTSLADLRKVMAVNHDALFLGIKHAVPALTDAKQRFPGGGVVINNLSMASYMVHHDNIGYHASKAAARMLTMCAAKEFGARGIRVNSIHPGVTITPLMREAFVSRVQQGLWESPDDAEASLAAMSPLGMTSEPADVAHAFVYLASDEARFMTGAGLCHDGGLAGLY